MSDKHLAKMILQKAKEHGDHIAMRYKTGEEWNEISYHALGEKIRTAALALIELGVREGDMVGIFSQNRPEWAITDFGILCAKAVTVPIYATNTAKQAEYIVNDAQIKIIFVGDREQYEKVVSFAGSCSYLTKIVVFDDDVKLTGDHLSFSDFLKIGEASAKSDEIERKLSTVSSDDLATLIYTSGTTGDPKGVMLTHENFFHQLEAVDKSFDVTPQDRSLCFLPLSHAYERTWSYYVFSRGAQNNYLANPKKIIEYMRDVKPTAMVSVPRLYEKIYSTAYDSVEKASNFKKKMFAWAVAVGKRYADRTKEKKPIGPYLKLQHIIADRLVLSKIRDIVGGPKNFFSAGGAALSAEIEEFFFAAGLLVCQGYGLTESSPMITYNSPGAFKFGTVGRPVPGCEVRIGEDGEILAKGRNIMKGYYNRSEETEETVVDGWLKTGDVGLIDEDGFVRITDRLKNLIITSGGKNIAPQRIETAVGSDHYIEQITAIGDGRKYVSALIVPFFSALENYAKAHGVSYETREELVKKPEIIEFYRTRIAEQSKELAGYEKIKAFSLLAREFTQEDGELTPTLKIKKKVVMDTYSDVIDAMYPED